jgi:hypothetical protein
MPFGGLRPGNRSMRDEKFQDEVFENSYGILAAYLDRDHGTGYSRTSSTSSRHTNIVIAIIETSALLPPKTKPESNPQPTPTSTEAIPDATEPFPGFIDICPLIKAESLHCTLHCRHRVCSRILRYDRTLPPCRCGVSTLVSKGGSSDGI